MVMANGRYRGLHHPGAGRQQHADVPCPNNYTSPIPGILASTSAVPLRLRRAPSRLRRAPPPRLPPAPSRLRAAPPPPPPAVPPRPASALPLRLASAVPPPASAVPL